MTITTIRTAVRENIALARAGWKNISANRIVSLTTYCALISALVGLIGIVLAWGKLPPQVPLWFSKTWGTERLAATPWLFLLPSSGILITLINMYIASFLTNEYLVFSQIMSLGSFVISLLSTITLIKIIFLVM